ncbi:MAG: c-type cytochrome, partial [Planctomycetes bacterium]|nr:c-type cytochrome [Planctomycetota bacterium]
MRLCEMFRPLLIAFLLLMASSVFAAEPLTGEQIYRQQCAKCHGAAGEGVKEFFPRPLVGDRSPAQLATLIAKTMPEDKPGTCVGPDAMHVSLYIHDTFYSTAARERNKPPRVELSHLTVRQYRHTVADLIGSFRAPVKMDERQGLKGEYFNARNFQANKRMIDRIDPEVRFDFGKAGPNDKFDAHQFCIRWEGSVIPPETGDYEFVIRTEHALRLWVNDLGRPLIDAWVKSGTDTEFRGSLYLIGGRAYSLRLEFSKAKQGVDDSKKNPNPPSLP